MNRSRRSMLRDAALLSLAGAANTYPLSLLSQAKKLKPKTGDPCNSFSTPGVRIFFAGSWLFCSSPDKTRIWAVARDLGSTPHNFPFGYWQANGIDKNGTSLPPNSSATPYMVGIENYTNNNSSASKLFSDTAAASPFTYLPNTANDIRFNSGAINLRIISVPIPTQIILAGFLVGAVVHGPKDVLAAINTTQVTGIATTHIFDYEGPQATLNFTPPTGSSTPGPDGPTIMLNAGQDFSSDMHFHTVPKIPDGMNHAQPMFNNLLNTIVSQTSAFGSGDFSLTIPTSAKFARGPYVSKCVSTTELEIPYAQMLSNLASCAGGAIGVGGDCGC